MMAAVLSKRTAGYLGVWLLCIAVGKLDAIFDIDVCINQQVCRCDDPAVGVYCSCNATVAGLTVWPFTLHKSHPAIVMRDCGTVDLQTLSLSTYPPRILEVASVQRLLLRHSVFHNIDGTVDRLLFADSAIPKIDPYVFFRMARLRRLEFRNVTIGSIATAAFGTLTDVGAIWIEGSRIGLIDERAFVNVSGVGSVRIVNSRIDRIAPDAVVLSHVDDFVMLNVSVGIWSNRSVTLVNASRVSVAGCDIGVMGDGALTTMLAGRLVFEGNRVALLHGGALGGLRDASNLSLVGNRIERMEPDAMLPLLSKDVVLEVVNNSLPCGEDLCSLVEDADLRSFETLLDSNWCLNDSRTLSEFTSMMDDEDVCHLGHASGAGNVTHHSTQVPQGGHISTHSSSSPSKVLLLVSWVPLSMTGLIAITLWVSHQ